MAKAAQQNSIWEGVYARFDDVPGATPVFDTSLWSQKQKERVKQALNAYKQSGAIPINAKTQDYPLASMTALMLAKKEKLHIVDYGGALGQSYIDLLAKIPNAEKNIKYTIIETEGLCEDIPPELSTFPNLRFLSEMSAVKDKADILHLGSTLQYIDDWQGLLKNMEKQFQPELFVLSDLLVGEIPTFVTAQSFHGQTIRARFTNIEEFIKFWAEMPYELIYRAYYHPVSEDEYFPNHALPETHRLKQPCHMVFARKGK
jgi:putative methyltransferase (TIGR04325 family)